MGEQPIVINHDISLRAALDMDNPGNIFMDGSTLAGYQARLVGKLSEHVPDTLHIRGGSDALLGTVTQRMQETHIPFVWLTRNEAYPVMAEACQIVIIPAESRLASEAFVIFRNAIGMRALVVWSVHQTAPVQSARGVLVTDPEQVVRLLDHLEQVASQAG